MKTHPSALRFTLIYGMMWLVGLALALVLCMLVLGGHAWMLSTIGQHPGHPLHGYIRSPLIGFLLLPACFTAMIQVARKRTSGRLLTSLPASLPFAAMAAFFAFELNGISIAALPSPYLSLPLNALAYFAIGHILGASVTYLYALLWPRSA